MTDQLVLTEFTPFDPAFAEDPYPAFTALREQSPVHHVDKLGWLVSRYDDVVAVCRDPGLWSSRSGPSSVPDSPRIKEIRQTGYPKVDTLLTCDPPEHKRYRSLVGNAFSTRRVAAIEDRIATVADELVDRFAGAGSVELVHQFAIPLPLTIIAEQLGVPVSDLHLFKEWSDAAVLPARRAAERGGARGVRLQVRRDAALLRGAHRRAPGRPAGRHAHRHGRGPPRGRAAARRARAAQHLRAVPGGRQRDHHQAHHRVRAAALPAPRPARRRPRRSLAGPRRGGGVAPDGVGRADDVPHRHARHRAGRRGHPQGRPGRAAHRRRQPRPGHLPRPRPLRRRAGPTPGSTSASPTASTTASVPRWRGPRRPSACGPC